MGDLLRVGATGGWVDHGAGLTCLGVFRTGHLPPSGRFLPHSGPPTAIVFLAAEAGPARIVLIVGDPYYKPGRIAVDVDVRMPDEG